MCAQHVPRFLSTLPARRFCCVPAAPSSTSPACKTLGSGAHFLGAPRRAEPSRPLLYATLLPHSCSLYPSFLPLPLPSTVFSFFYRTPHSFIHPSSALPLSLCPSPCTSLSRFYSPSLCLIPLIFVLLPCRPSPPSPPSPAGVSVRGAHWLPAPAPGTGAPLPLPEPRGWRGLRGAGTHGRGAEGPRIPRRPRVPSHARHGGGDGQVREEGLAPPVALGGARSLRERFTV